MTDYFTVQSEDASFSGRYTPRVDTVVSLSFMPI